MGSYFCWFPRACAVTTRSALPLNCLAAVGSPVAGDSSEVWIIVKFEDCHPEEHEIGLPILLVPGCIYDEVEAALNKVEGRENKFQVWAVIRIFAPDVLVNHDWHVADKVSHTHSGNGLSHAVVTG